MSPLLRSGSNIRTQHARLIAAAVRTPIRPRLGRTGGKVAMIVVATHSATATGSRRQAAASSEEAEGG